MGVGGAGEDFIGTKGVQSSQPGEDEDAHGQGGREGGRRRRRGACRFVFCLHGEKAVLVEGRVEDGKKSEIK